MSVEFFDHGESDLGSQHDRFLAESASLAACYAVMPHSMAHGIERAASKPLHSAAAERQRARIGYGGLSYERLAW